MITARYMLHLVEPLFLRLTQDNLTDHIDIKMRTLSLSWACSMGSTECQAQAGDLFSRWMEADSPDTSQDNQ